MTADTHEWIAKRGPAVNEPAPLLTAADMSREPEPVHNPTEEVSA
jgi:hypothetical protein